MGLSHEDFVKYFIDSNNFFEHEVFESAFRFLDSDAQAFWGTIYTEGVTPREIYNQQGAAAFMQAEEEACSKIIDEFKNKKNN